MNNKDINKNLNKLKKQYQRIEDFDLIRLIEKVSEYCCSNKFMSLAEEEKHNVITFGLAAMIGYVLVEKLANDINSIDKRIIFTKVR